MRPQPPQRQGVELMKAIFNIASVAVVSIVSTISLANVPTYAIETVKTEVSCARVASLALTSTAEVTKRLATMQSNFIKRLADVNSRHDEVDQKVATVRTEATSKFDAKLVALKAQTGLTTAQLAAIDTFGTGVHDAQDVRRAAVDAARDAYRSALAGAISANQTSLTAAASAYKSSVDTAFTIAQSTCSESTALPTLRSSIKSARETFMNATKRPDDTTAAIRQLVTTRDAAIKTADTAFVAKVTSLKTTLKAALKAQ